MIVRRGGNRWGVAAAGLLSPISAGASPSLKVGTEYARLSYNLTIKMTTSLQPLAQQRLMLAPNVTMALEVLRMPTMELHSFLRQQLGENPLLELEETDLVEVPDEPNIEERNELYDQEWTDHWRTASEREFVGDDYAARRHLERPINDQPSLMETLLAQLRLQQLSKKDYQLAEVLIQRINENGYLDTPLVEIASELSADIDRLEGMLGLVQGFEPPGIGARDLRECLLLQLEQKGEQDGLGYMILKNHFELFAQRRLRALARSVGISMEQAREACRRLKKLNPKPGSIFSGELPPDVNPDLVIRYGEHHYDVELNDSSVPRITINRTYRSMLNDENTPQDAKEFLEEKFRKARWLIRAIDERNATLLAISRCLISLQRDFVDQGPRALKPLTQAQVAQMVGRHPSTISRAIRGKTIDTPYGVFWLEQLFAGAVPQSNKRANISDERIKSEIKRFVAQEDPRHPLSDEAIVERLSSLHIIVARRTIAKYRNSLKILPAHLRRQHL